ncbi:hypothetical protein DFH06DRAFT_1129799 [Mycena polygramma]|nr:hypothetical protein DFH06DRAFT_1129799 [Mycena polygramma]
MARATRSVDQTRVFSSLLPLSGRSSPKSPAKPALTDSRSKSPKSTPKKKAVSNKFVNDEAEESDGRGNSRAEDASQAEEGPEDDKWFCSQSCGYESDFINDGDPFHGSDVASEHAYDLFVFLSDYTVRLLIVLSTPPPPGQRTEVKGKRSPLKASSSDVTPNDNVIEVPTSSDEDMEAMDEDDSMFRKAGVKPSGAAKRSAVSEQDVEPPVKQLKPAARIRSKRAAESDEDNLTPVKKAKITVRHASEDYTPEFIKKMNDYMAKHKYDSDAEEEPPEKSRNTRTDKRVDFDDVELQRGIAASSKFAAKTASKKKSVSESLKQSSPDWEAPYDGTLKGGSSSANVPKSKSDKGKGKAVVKTEPSNKTAKVSPKVGKTIKTNPNSILAKFVGKDAKATMSQCFGGSDGEVEVADSEEVSSDDDARGPAQEVFLEDLETYRSRYNAKGKCGVSDPDLQDPLLAESYAHLPLLPCRI